MERDDSTHTSSHRTFREANDPDTPHERLAELSASSDELIRGAIALNPATPESVLESFAKDDNSHVQSCLAQRTTRRRFDSLIHSTALVSPSARLGNGVSVGAYSIVHDNVEIGDNTIIESYCEIGYSTPATRGIGALQIGADSLIRSHSVFYQGSTIGARLVTGHRVTVREKTIAGENLQIGTLSDIQGHCEIGDFVRFHSNVHIGQHSRIGNFVWIFPYVVLTNDPHPPSEVMSGVSVEDYAAIATMSVVLPGVRIGEGALIGAHSSVTKDVEPNTVVVGAPAKYACDTESVKLKDGSGRNAYPWRYHFHRGYPEEVVSRWLQEIEQL